VRNVGLPGEVLGRWAVTGITAAHLDGALAPCLSFKGPTLSHAVRRVVVPGTRLSLRVGAKHAVPVQAKATQTAATPGLRAPGARVDG
jgi:hypothetical protein